jgi:hypothetical protein
MVGADLAIASGILLVADALVAVIAGRLRPAQEARRIPAAARAVLSQIALQIVDDIAAALDGPDVFFPVTAGEAFADVRRRVMLARGETIALELLLAAGREVDRRLADPITLGVIVDGQRIKAGGQKKGEGNLQPSCRSR